MKLIIDSGSTKIQCILLDGNNVKSRFDTDGFNPNYSAKQDLNTIIETRFLPSIQESVQSIYYYGTGCGNERNCLMIKEMFQRYYPQAEINVTHDLMAACHALLGYERGVACILGTGSNACVYDGERITERAVSLGYLVGDEGSGMQIGREVVKAYFYGFMPNNLRQKFDETYHLELKDFIDKAYHQPQPSKYLATFSKFAGEHQQDPFMHDLVLDCFEAFLKAFVFRFEGCRTMTISFIGSVAYHFQDILKECIKKHDLTMGEVMKSPADGLIRYYSFIEHS